MRRDEMAGAASQDKGLAHIKRLVVIGDSLSDSEGRMQSKSLGIMLSSRQYHEGRFSNGFVWTDFLGSRPYLDKEVVNYAEGGAVAGRYSRLKPVFLFISDMGTQIRKHDFRPGDMAVLALGSNDYMTFGKTDVDKVIRTYETQINKLVGKGVQNILVAGVPDLSQTVHARKQTQDPEYGPRMAALSRQHNDKLQQLVDTLQSRYQEQDVKIRFFDIGQKLDYLMSLADEVGYDTEHNQHAGYIDLPRVFGLAGDTRPLNTSHRHIFHDEVHPSQEVHQILASHMADFIQQEFGTASMDTRL